MMSLDRRNHIHPRQALFPDAGKRLDGLTLDFKWQKHVTGPGENSERRDLTQEKANTQSCRNKL